MVKCCPSPYLLLLFPEPSEVLSLSIASNSSFECTFIRTDHAENLQSRVILAAFSISGGAMQFSNHRNSRELESAHRPLDSSLEMERDASRTNQNTREAKCKKSGSISEIPPYRTISYSAPQARESPQQAPRVFVDSWRRTECRASADRKLSSSRH